MPKREVVPSDAPPQLNSKWAIDFVEDSLNRGRSYRLPNVPDEVNREALVLEVDFSLASTRVVAVLDQLVPRHGWP